MRLLDKDKLMLDMTKLGFEPESLAKFEAAISKPWGMVLVTGPTGSGKTNTLYSSISRINTPETNIMTAEDPVEFNLPGINQVQVRESIGLTFAAALRSFLRQDPNIILVGEIRDFETAEIAVKAALTGPPRALDAAHQRRAEHHQPPDEHGHRAVPRRELGNLDLRAAPRAPHLRQCKAEHPCRRRRWWRSASRRGRRDGRADARARAATSATTPATRAGSGLYEVMEITDELRELILSARRRWSCGARRRGGDDHPPRQSGLRRSRTA